jgi:hypothetical protein
MTIGIAAHGPKAGLAVFNSLRAAENVGTGSIGGFATFAAITADGRLLRHQTQRGGSRTLFLRGEQTGVDPPGDVADAIFAGVISSGPERPDVERLLTADARAGLVTGHRLPIARGIDGLPLNQQTLDLLIEGRSAQAAVDQVMSRNPEADAGLIAVDMHGQVYGRNSARVLRRPDLAEGREASADGGASVVVFYNAIRPYKAIAGLVTAVAMETMIGVPAPDDYVIVDVGIPVLPGPESAIHCGPDGRATHLTTADLAILSGRHLGAVISLGSSVFSDGRLIGHAMLEVLTTVVDGALCEMSGQTSVPFGFRRVREESAGAPATGISAGLSSKFESATRPPRPEGR